MDILILFSLLAVLVAILAIVHFLPVLIVKRRASTLGLRLTFRQARIVTRDFCNRKDFLLMVKEIWFWADIPIDKLTRHYNAKGDLTNLRDGIIAMKQKNRDIDFPTLSLFDLAGRDLKEEIKKAEIRNWVFDLTTG